LEVKVAKKDPVLRMKYYEGVRELTQALAEQADAAILHLKALGDDFADVFEKTHKRHNALLDKVSKRIERELKKSTVAPKAAAKPVNAATPKVVNPKKTPAIKRGTESKPKVAK
jgi:hypothetical protein